MKIRNKMGYLGFLGILGLLGLITGNPGLFGFFGFFGFFGAIGGKGSDERVEKNINKSCRNTFVFVTVASSLSLAYAGSFNDAGSYPALLALPYAASMILFAVSYIHYDRKGDSE